MPTWPPGARSWHARRLRAMSRAAMVARVPETTLTMTDISYSRSRSRRLKAANIVLILGLIAVADLALYGLLYP